jgi:Rod binding domain-containing protein
MMGINTITEASPVNNDLKRLRNAVGEVVGSVFYGTLLKTMRNSVMKGPYGHGGRGEEIFAAQLDGILAGEMGKATRGGLTEALYADLEKQQRLISEHRPL